MPHTKLDFYQPELAFITVSGPTQVGKSIVIDRIKKAIENEFGANVVVDAPDALTDADNLADWERKMVRNTIWYITELPKPTGG